MREDDAAKSIELEVPVDSVAGLKIAVEGGASRVELCSDLSVGGLTPGAGFIEFAARQNLPVAVLIRPRAGNFVYCADEIAAMERDIVLVAQHKLAGVVIGAATKNDGLDLGALRRLVKAAGGVQICLNRVFDLVPDPFEALEQAVQLGVSRILTSGQCKTAPEGSELLARLVERAGRRIQILPAGGINPKNLPHLLSKLSVPEIHASCRKSATPGKGRLVDFGFTPRQNASRTDLMAVRDMVAALNKRPFRAISNSPAR